MTSERIRSGRKMRRAKTWRGARTNSSRRMTFAVKGDEISIEMDIGAGGEHPHRFAIPINADVAISSNPLNIRYYNGLSQEALCTQSKVVLHKVTTCKLIGKRKDYKGHRQIQKFTSSPNAKMRKHTAFNRQLEMGSHITHDDRR